MGSTGVAEAGSGQDRPISREGLNALFPAKWKDLGPIGGQ
jgi:hypothetical protein